MLWLCPPTNNQIHHRNEQSALSYPQSLLHTSFPSPKWRDKKKNPIHFIPNTLKDRVSVTRLCRGKHHLQHREPLLRPLITVTVKPLLSCFTVITLPSHGNLCEIGLDSKVLMSVWVCVCVCGREEEIQSKYCREERRGGAMGCQTLWTCESVLGQVLHLRLYVVPLYTNALAHWTTYAVKQGMDQHGTLTVWQPGVETQYLHFLWSFYQNVHTQKKKKKATRCELAVQILF